MNFNKNKDDGIINNEQQLFNMLMILASVEKKSFPPRGRDGHNSHTYRQTHKRTKR